MRKAVKILLYVFFVIYCLALVKFLLLDGRHVHTEATVGEFFSRSNFIPFKTVYDYIVRLKNDTINADIVIKNLIGNLIVLFPMGCFLPCMFQKCRKWWKTLVICFGIVLLVELLQLFLRMGSLDVDDFIFNLSGACLGYAFVHIPFLQKMLQKTYVYTEPAKQLD